MVTMAKAKGWDQAVGPTPIALVLALSTPSTHAQFPVLGSSAPPGTSRTAQMGRAVVLVLRDEAGLGDRGIP